MFDHIETVEELKRAYKAAARKAHPDMGGTDAEMQRVNAAYDDACKRIEKQQKQRTEESASAEELAKYAQVLRDLIIFDDLEIELVGSWVWVTGNTYPHKDAIKAAGMHYSKKHKAWYWHSAEDGCGRSRKNDTLDDIKQRHGCKAIKTSCGRRLAAG